MNRTVNYKLPIVILSATSLIFYIVCFILNLSTFSFYSFIICLLTVLASTLLILYVFGTVKQLTLPIIVPVVFCFSLAPNIMSLIRSVLTDSSMPVGIIILFCVLAFVNILPIISSFKGLSNKKFITVPIIIFIVINLVSLFTTTSVGGINASSILRISSQILLYFALILFGTKNKTPQVFHNSQEKIKKKAEKMSSEDALKYLKECFDNGYINEEEYKTMRAKIINNL